MQRQLSDQEKLEQATAGIESKLTSMTNEEIKTHSLQLFAFNISQCGPIRHTPSVAALIKLDKTVMKYIKEQRRDLVVDIVRERVKYAHGGQLPEITLPPESYIKDKQKASQRKKQPSISIVALPDTTNISKSRNGSNGSQRDDDASLGSGIETRDILPRLAHLRQGTHSPRFVDNMTTRKPKETLDERIITADQLSPSGLGKRV